jgi:hypothetical protein
VYETSRHKLLPHLFDLFLNMPLYYGALNINSRSNNLKIYKQVVGIATGNDRPRDPECTCGTSILILVDWESLPYSRARNQGVTLYKIANRRVKVPVHHLIQ